RNTAASWRTILPRDGNSLARFAMGLSRSPLVPQASYGSSVTDADIGDNAFQQKSSLGLTTLVQVDQDFPSLLLARAAHGDISCYRRAFGRERGGGKNFADRLKCFRRTLHILAKPLHPLQ